jgi:Mrp family chromosome partitioning ATPase
MAAAAIAARVPLLNARQSEAAVACRLAFDEPGGPLIAVCGLVGGSGASTLSLCLARQAAHESAAPVLLTELDASSAGLAVFAGQAGALSLRGLAQQVADGQTPARAFVELESRLRLLVSPSRHSPKTKPPSAPSPDYVIAGRDVRPRAREPRPLPGV